MIAPFPETERAMSESRLKKIAVTLRAREDGGLHIHSADVPGLHLSGPDPQAVWSKLPKAVRALLAANAGLIVSAVYLPELGPTFVQFSEQDVAMHVRLATVIVEFEPLAA
jgi:hypothetical protein